MCRLIVLLIFQSVVVCGWASTVVLENGRILDVRTGQLLSGQAILISDGRIEAVGKPDQLTIPANATRINLNNATLLPGLTDSHTHQVGRAAYYGYQSLAESLPRASITGVANARATVMAGFTTVRNLGAPGYADIALRDAIAEGEIPGPRILAAGPSIGITGGHCDSNLLPFEFNNTSDGVADGPWAVRKKVRQNVKYGANVIKFCATGGVLSKGTKIGAQQFTFEEMEALIDEAHLLGLKVAAHAHGTDGIKTAIKAGVDSVEHASLIDDEGLRLAKKAGTFLSMDVYVSDFILTEGEASGVLPESLEKERQVGKAQRERFQKAVRQGIKLAFGTDAGVYPHGLNARQFKFMVQWGMTPLQAIQAATIGNAELFGMSDQIGSIETGKYADIIAVTGNPLEDVTVLENVQFVMKDGAVLKNQL